MAHLLLEHMIGDGGSITVRKGGSLGVPLLKIIKDAESVESPYRDISSLLNWYKWGHNLGYDFMFIRQKMVDLYNGDITTYSTEEQEAILAMDVATPEEIATVFDNEKAFSVGREFLELSNEARVHRVNLVSMLIRSQLGLQQAFISMLPLSDRPPQSDINYIFLYERFNIKSLAISGLDGIIDYFLSTAGFTGQGFKELPLVPLPTASLTLSELGDNVAEILNLGTWKNGEKVPGLA